MRLNRLRISDQPRGVGHQGSTGGLRTGQPTGRGGREASVFFQTSDREVCFFKQATAKPSDSSTRPTR